MNTEECITTYLKENYESISWSSTGNPVLNGEELLNSELKDLKDKLVAYVTLNGDKKVTPGDLTKPWLKKIFKSLEGEVVDQEESEEKSKFDKDRFLSDKPAWYAKLLYGKDGIKSAQTNVEIYLEESDLFKDSLYFDEFAERIMFKNEPFVTTRHFSTISQAVEVDLGFNNRYLIEQAINGVALRHKVNPVIRALEKLRWDGEKRLETYFVNILGAPDTPLTRKITLNFFYAMMKRIYIPGSPFSGMPILLDTMQNTGKTELLAYLLKVIEEDVGYTLTDIIKEGDLRNEKDLIHRLKSKLVMIFDECNALLKGDDAWLKSFITERQDEVRLPYGREPECYKRKCVFIANSNDNNLLKDYTGGVDDIQRRYQIIECHGKPRDNEDWDRDHNEKYRKQILAEAVKFYKDNPDYEYIRLPKNMEKEMIEIQSRHKTLNENDDIILNINTILQAKIYQDEVVTKDPRSVKQFKDRVKEYLMSTNMMETGKSIEKIDASVLKMVAKEFCRYNQSSQKLTHMMRSIGWDKKKNTTARKVNGDYFVYIEGVGGLDNQISINI